MTEVEYAEPYVNKLVFNEKEDDDAIITGGYPMSSFLEFENLSNQFLGGAKKIGVDRFKDLAIPFSLDTHHSNYNDENYQKEKPKKSKPVEVIADGLFEKLVDSIIVAKKQKQTRKDHNIEVKPKTKTTRKSRPKK
jgi:hypothetical protein|uniref:Uncharacterized protein n=1 Tax=viral metagenome TaxID=1070528 RepID=A0A6C0ARS8_9ZZZZ